MNENLKGAGFIVLAGICFALANAVTWTVTYKMGFKAQSDAFWQYAIAAAFSVPFIWHQGLASMKTRHPVLHLVRIALSVLGVQAFTQAFASGMAPWLVLSFAPDLTYWPGILMVFAGSIYLLWSERSKSMGAALA